MVRGGTVAVAALIAAAPLAAGGVHRGTTLVLLAAAAAGLIAVAVGLAGQGRPLRVGLVALIPAAFLFVPLAQAIPLPLGLRGLLDPGGNELLRANDLLRVSFWPLSLDPPSTRVNIARTALALVVFLVAYHLASGRSQRHLLPRVLAAAGIAAVAVGLGHRIFGISKLYGMFGSSGRALLVGPFVNSNHTAEFLELSAFVCLACSFQRDTALNRIGWLVGMLLCAGGAMATLSRGAIAALLGAALAFALLRHFSREGGAEGRRRTTLLWAGGLMVLMLVGAAALGASQLIDRFRAASVTTDVRFQLWRDGFRVLAEHPFGIGRGAFDRVFPVYRTVKSSFPIRFAFLENEPLQLLVDSGWFFFALMAVALGLAIWQIVRHGRRDRIESALIAGLLAVGIHSLVDFGLETPGVLLPFTAVLATVLGRMRNPSEAPSRRGWMTISFAVVALVIGTASTAHSSSGDMDGRLKATRGTEERRALLRRAQLTHPVDYFYVLSYARLEPLRDPAGRTSPRLHVLNRALRLCPSCDLIHAEVARSLWRLGLRQQSLLEWRSAVQLQPQLFNTALGELFKEGAKPAELAAIAADAPGRIVEVAAFLSSVSHVDDAFVVLDQADALEAPRAERLLTRARLQLQAGRSDEALATTKQAHQEGVHDARLDVLDAELLTIVKADAGVDEALAVLDGAATRYPLNLEVQRARLGLVTRYGKWYAASRALEGLKLALYKEQGSAAEAHIASARIAAQLGRWTEALTEYRIALADNPGNVALWLELGNAARRGGRNSTAREAYATAARISPNSPEITKALKELDERSSAVRSLFDERRTTTGSTEP